MSQVVASVLVGLYVSSRLIEGTQGHRIERTKVIFILERNPAKMQAVDMEGSNYVVISLGVV